MPNNHITFFVSTDAHDRILRKFRKEVKNCIGSVWTISFLTGILFAIIVDQKRKIEELEKRITQQEMAG